jgi:phage baseplate assembly protein gpV
MHSSHPIHRALVTFSNSTTGEIRVKIPALLGADSEVAISYIGRKAPWVVPTVGDQIVVTSDDTNLTNVFWMPTSTTQGVSGINGDWATAQPVIPFSSATDGMGVLQPSSAGKLVYNTGSQTVYVNNFTAFSVGQRVDFARLNSGTFTISAASGATVDRTPANTLRAQYSAASLICTSANAYLLIGDLG